MMAEVAAIFHWPPAVLEAMTFEELRAWREQAVAIWNRMNATAQGT